MGRKKTGTIKQRGEKSFRIRYRDASGTRHAETIKGTREDAERELAIRLGDIARGLPASSKPNTVLFGELCNDVVVDYEIRGLRSKDDIECRFTLHIIPALGNRKAAQITTAMLKQYILNRQAEDPRPANGTINREMEAIRRAFRLAIIGRKLIYSPHIPMLKENNVRTGFLTRQEVDAMCGHLESPAREFVLFGFLTGWRYGEIQQLEWRNVDFATGEVRIDPGSTKNGEGRFFPMTKELRGILTSLFQSRSPLVPFVFTRKGARPGRKVETPPGKPRRNAFDIRVEWLHACHKAGLPCVVDAENRPIKALRVFHDLRRSASIHMELFDNLKRPTIKALLGHKTDSMFNRYRQVGIAEIRAAGEAIDAARDTLRPAGAIGAKNGTNGNSGPP